jgi:large subunit ribosomal protein L33
MATKKKTLVKLKCEVCKQLNYDVKKSKGKVVGKKLELSKFCKWCRKNTKHKESKR